MIHYQKGADGIVTLTLELSSPVNAVDAQTTQLLADSITQLQAEADLKGVIVTSAKKIFSAGADLKAFGELCHERTEVLFNQIEALKLQYRALEQLNVPVVAAVNGSAFGGGWELALACNYRIVLDDKKIKLGLPEVELGLLPGAGGVVRSVYYLGLERALPYLLQGKRYSPQHGLELGLVNELASDGEQLVAQAKAWINSDQAQSQQAWDQKGFRLPGGRADTPALAGLQTVMPAKLKQQTRGLLPAPEQILNCAVEAARMDFDTALRFESRKLTQLMLTPEAKNLISAFFQMKQVQGGASRPAGIPKQVVNKVGIIGAGMMGQGIAYSSAVAGIEVVLKDISIEAAEKGKAYTERLLNKKVAKGRMDEAKRDQILARIHPTAENSSLHDCELIIEAVFENIELKNQLIQGLEADLPDNCVWGSNTSSLPITQLAEASKRPKQFIGVHFFSPVDKMPLVELICGEQTDDLTLARAFDYSQQIRKIPIVVNDSLAFYTSRTFSTYIDEGARLLSEGVHPVQLDSLGKSVGMPVGPLAVHDEVSLELTRKLYITWDEMGVAEKWGERDALRSVVDTMIGDYGRGGRYHGGGFYQYHEDGSKVIWNQLFELYYQPELEMSETDIKDRLLFRQVIEALKCLETNVLRSAADGNIGSLMGIGAPKWTGGWIQFVNGYGLERFITRCGELSAQYGKRFNAPQIVQKTLAEGREL